MRLSASLPDALEEETRDEEAAADSRLAEESAGVRPAAARRSRYGYALRVAAGAAILVWLAVSGRLDLSILAHVRPGLWPALLLLVGALAQVSTSARWVCLARASGQAGSIGGLLRVALSSNVLSFISPAGTGTDAARIYYLVRMRKVSGLRALGIGLTDRLLGMQTLLVFATLLGWMTPLHSASMLQIRTALTLLTVGVSVLLLGLMLPGTRRFLVRRLPAAWRTRFDGLEEAAQPGLLPAAYLCSLLAAAANFALPMLGLSALFGVGRVSLETYYAGGLVVLVNTVAPTPGGLGFGEAAAASLMNHSTSGASAMLLVRAVLLLWALTFGLGYFTGGAKLNSGADTVAQVDMTV